MVRFFFRREPRVKFSNQIPEKFIDQISQMPETSYGATRVEVTMEDGEIFRDVVVAWGVEIVRVGKSTKIPFDPNRIVSVRTQP